MYALLAKVFREEPDAEFLARLRDPHNAELLGDFGFSLAPGLQDLSLDELIEDLAVEYTQLFVGPGPHLSPHESVHIESGVVRDGELWGPQTVKVKAFIDLARAPPKLQPIPITSPVERISGPRIGSTPGNLINGKTASFIE